MAADKVQKPVLPESDLCVFLLGAGASAELGPPIMRDFMQRARRNYFNLNREFTGKEAAGDWLLQDYAALMKFYSEMLHASWAVNRDWENIEELYTQADLRRLAQLPDGESSEALCEHLAWAIWDVYRQHKETLNLQAICAKVTEAGLSPVFISTNYDLICEASLGFRRAGENHWQYYYPGFQLPEMTAESHVLRTSDDINAQPQALRRVPIVKLHGSANWFVLGDEWFAVTNFGDAMHTAGNANTILETNLHYAQFLQSVAQMAGKTGIELGENRRFAPAIIPPMLGKASESKVIATQWSFAIDAIARAREIWVIGYSFPSTDAFMSRLFAEGLHKNVDLEKFRIIDKQSRDMWTTRIDSLFNPTFRWQKFDLIDNTLAKYAFDRMAVESVPNWSEQTLRRIP